jgi:prepilin-type N-terminal cleavage/methylation domain-containing protein
MLEPRRKIDLTHLWQTRQGRQLLPPPPRQSAQSGFTIIEALVALIIASILLIGLAPIVVLSVASRVQARRVDLGTQAARSYIDGLRAAVITPPSNNAAQFDQPDLGVTAPTAMDDNLGTCVDKNIKTLASCSDPTNPPFLYIQAFRNRSDIPPNQSQDAVKQGYCVGVRVYRADAFNGGAAPNGTQPLKNMFTESSTTKNYPLVVMRAEILNQTSFQDYASRFPVPNPNPNNDPPQGSPCG